VKQSCKCAVLTTASSTDESLSCPATLFGSVTSWTQVACWVPDYLPGMLYV